MPASSEKMQMKPLREMIVLEGGVVAHPVCDIGVMDGVTPMLVSTLSF